MESGGSVYIISNKDHSVFYVGVCTNVAQRLNEHREKIYPNSFTAKHDCVKLVFFESFTTLQEAIDRENELNSFPSSEISKLVEDMNPEWDDLGEVLKEA